MSYDKELIKYVKQNEKLEELAKTLQEWPILENDIIVYRGHNKSETIRKSNFYSTSKNIKLVHNNFTGKSCCIFKIHVMPGFHYLDVNKIMGKNHRYAEDKEVIIEGNGDFFKDSLKKEKGFKNIGLYKEKQIFETFYYPKEKITYISYNDLLKRMPENELSLYNSESELHDVLKTLLKTNEVLSNSNGGGKKSDELNIRQILITKPILDEIKKKKNNPSFLSQFTIQKGEQGFPLTRMKSMKTIKKSKFKSFIKKNPIIVKSTQYGKKIDGEKKRLYELVDGRHRLTRAIKLGKKTIHVKVE